jgi:hypothetical protein
MMENFKTSGLLSVQGDIDGSMAPISPFLDLHLLLQKIIFVTSLVGTP